ncbi:MAG: translation elongation factor Ts [Clostridia bacterium]|jgi:elongation factor Ts|nr:translation elongation factor Ts [Clostridia bacterium]
MAVTASMVKELRDMTGAGMLDCKKALVENDGNIEKAVDFLREKGLSKAAKKAGRIAAEGLVKVLIEGNKGTVVEVNSETDFVAKNEDFVNFVADVAEKANKMESNDVEAFLNSDWDGKTVSEVLTSKIAVIGENLSIRRFENVTSEGVLESYIHGGGKIGVLIEILNADNNDAVKEAAKNIAMQVAALNPKFISREDVDSEYIEHERSILKEQALQEGKPANIVDKMVEGRVQKLYKEVCLLEQAYVKDGDLTVKAYLESVASGATLGKVVRFETGEGIEKKEENFADEVAKQIKGE